MPETATSMCYPPSSRPTTTPAARPPTNNPGSVGQNMPPLLSPRTTTATSQPPAVKTPSPNYFGFQSEDSSFLTDSPQHANSNFSPPSSAVRSTAAASPSVVPLDQNPDYDAFRRQSDGKAFNLGGLGNNFKMSAPPPSRPEPQTSTSRTEQSNGTKTHGQSKSLDPNMADTGRSPKRVLSPGSMILPEEVRRASPASFAKSESDGKSDSQPRFALPLDNMQSMNGLSKPRAETLPNPGDLDAQLMVTPQHVVNLLESRTEQVLLLDLRVQTQYARSHISGALNLCIPTTLLKRPSFTVQKLADAFKDDEQRRKFERWRSSTYIIVYDGCSGVLKDAQICVNTIKKFRAEGYEGSLYIVKGGFTDFERRFPSYVTQANDSNSSDPAEMGVDCEGPEVAPVVGGCPMPATDKPANPFFGNIRQNMDLIGGVGQIPIKHPSKASSSAEREFPEWLQKASDDRDEGKKVANKFEQIERREKRRMEDALSGKVSWGGTPRPQAPDNSCVQIAGIEKGTKNRYNNIWPFEHSRVKLQGVASQGCDYVNASHIKAAWSNKRYISTQAPIPATFNDFWNIVWQQDVRVIVMLTAEKEGAQVKAHNYWEKRQYGPLHLDFLSEKRASIEPDRIHRHRQPIHNPSAHRPAKRTSTGPPTGFFDVLTPAPTNTNISDDRSSDNEPYVIVRRFTLSHERHPFEPMREITQLQYSNWPDFGAPAHPAHLLGLVEQCDNVVRSSKPSSSRQSTSSLNETGPANPEQRPILVHCSAGCGRTGTFCTVDSVIDMLKRQRLEPRSTHEAEGEWVARTDLDLVEKTVEDFRLQRLSMVQSLRQYVLCYESVMEWLVREGHGQQE